MKSTLAILLVVIASVGAASLARGDTADLSVTTTVDDPFPDIGDDVTFTVVLENSGPDPATGVEVTDLLPVGLTYLDDTPSQGSYDDGSGIWSVGTVAVSGSATLDLSAQVDVDTSVQNWAELTASDQLDPDSTPGNGDPLEDDQDSAYVNGLADLSLTKGDDPDPVATDGTLTYTLTVTNDGPVDTRNVVVSDTLPAGVTFVSASGASWNCSGSGGVVTCTRLSLANGASSIITIVVTAPSSGGSIVNAAAVTSDATDPVPGDNLVAETTTVTPVADLKLMKTVDDTEADQGDIVTYTITVTNDGPDDATGVVVKDGFPAGKLDYRSDTPSQGSYDDATGEWTVGTIGTGATATLDIECEVLVQTENDPITNIAEVIATNEPDPDSTPNNSATEPDEDDTDSVMVRRKAHTTDLSIAKSDSLDPVGAGDVITYTVTVTNLGPDRLTAGKGHTFHVVDELPPGTVFRNTGGTHANYQVTYDPVEHTVTAIWASDLRTNRPRDVVIRVSAPPSGGIITNTATVEIFNTDPSEDPAIDNNSANDEAVEQTTVTALSTDLSVAKVVDVASPYEGQGVTYTITLSNLGPNDGTAIEVTDLLPAGVVYVSDDPSQGSYDDATGVWTVGAVANGSDATLDIVATVEFGTAWTTITNTASVTAADQSDPVGANNTDSADIDVIIYPDVRVTKTSATLSDPVNGGTNPKAIPGATVTYTVTVTNEGEGPTDGDTVTVTDAVPAGSELFVGDIGGPGSGPVLFAQGATPSGLTYAFIALGSDLDDIEFSDNGGLSYDYEPVPDVDGFDANVTHFRIIPGGVFAASDGVDHPSLSVEFRTRVQ